jgi:hypothetical protein
MMTALSSVAFGAVSHLTAGRGQMGTSLSFHFFFAAVLPTFYLLYVLFAHQAPEMTQ